MNAVRLILRCFTALLVVLLAGCVSLGGSPQFAEMDFPAIIAGHGYMVHTDDRGEATANEIDFLKNETITQWDVAGLDQIITTDKVDAHTGGDSFDVKYYKNKAFVRSYNVENTAQITWMILVPEKNCMVMSVLDPIGHPRRLVKIDLATGTRKQVTLEGFPYIKSKPILDKRNGNLIIVLTSKDQSHLDQFNNPFPYDSLATLNVDDLTIKNLVPLDDTQIDGLLFADAQGQHVTAYGMMGGWPLFLTGTPGIIEFDLATGKPTMIMKDTMPGMFMYDYIGIAAVNRQYVLMTKVGGYSFENPKSYCVDLKNQGWEELPGPFKYPISHDGLKMNGSQSADANATSTK